MPADTVRVESPFRQERRARVAPPPPPVAVEPPRSPAPPERPPEPLPGLREWTGYEEDVVERRAREANTAALCNEVLAMCLVAPGADPAAVRERVAALTIAQRDQALLDLRIRTLGPRVNSHLPCPSCKVQNEAELDLTALKAPAPAAPARLTVEATAGGRFELRPPTAGDQADLLDAAAPSASVRRSWLLARLLLRWDGREGPFAVEEVHALPTGVRQQLEAALAPWCVGADLRLAATCHACGAAFQAPFEVPGFFLPS